MRNKREKNEWSEGRQEKNGGRMKGGKGDKRKPEEGG